MGQGMIPVKEAARLCGLSNTALRLLLENEGVPLHGSGRTPSVKKVDLTKSLLRRGLSLPPELAQGAKVLLVDDDPDVLLLMVDALEASVPGLRVATARDGRSAFRRLVEFRPDLLITDVDMPGMTGLELCRWTRQNGDLAATRILAVTGLRGREAAARENGADACLPKPLSPETLRRAAAILLEGGVL